MYSSKINHDYSLLALCTETALLNRLNNIPVNGQFVVARRYNSNNNNVTYSKRNLRSCKLSLINKSFDRSMIVYRVVIDLE